MRTTELRLRKRLTGLGFPEGPVALGDGRVAFVELLGQCVSLMENGTKRLVVRLPGAPNGAALGPDGALYVANNGGIAPLNPDQMWHAPDAIDGCIQRVSLAGDTTPAVVALPGPPPHRPNDLCFASDGRLFFTDPANWEILPDRSRYRDGLVFAVPPGGRAEPVAEVPDFPNGIAIDPSGTNLVVAQTEASRLLAFSLRADGSLGPAQVFSELPDGVAPDGLCFASDGTLYVAGSVSDKIAIIGPERELLEIIDTGPGSDPTNLCLDNGRLWVTLGFLGELAYLDVDKDPLLRTGTAWL